MTGEEICIDTLMQTESELSNNGLKHLSRWPAVALDFQDLTYSVPDLTVGRKTILRGVSGKFRSNQLTAILGPSGAGKSTLLNILAGFKSFDATGTVCVNGKPRNVKLFRKMSRYIMQQDIFQPMLTVEEAMMFACDLKLGKSVTATEKKEIIAEILNLLRLTSASKTTGQRLSGGERKRLSIALELINNPPVIFLDEPTTGLDDLSSSQCVGLLRRIAHSGRTVICSIHTPSAKIFAMFDHVYVMANGQCVYQGDGSNIVSYIETFGLECPVTYNPADYVIEVSCGEYGIEYVDKMVSEVDNGRAPNWQSSIESSGQQKSESAEEYKTDISEDKFQSHTSGFEQFVILVQRMWIQMWRDSSYVKLRVYMHILLGFLIGGLFQGIGNDASKTLFNFGFCFTIIIFFMYIPMMPILLHYPIEIQLLKREHFNRWYRLNAYYVAMLFIRLPMQILMALLYVTIVYFITGQLFEWHRILMFYCISILVSLTSESFGVMVASRLSIVNGMFVGPVCAVPIMLLAVYGIGYGRGVIVPGYVRLLMSLSYLRYGLEGLVAATYGFNRRDMQCPDDIVYCQYQKAQYLMTNMGFEDVSFSMAVIGLSASYVLFTWIGYYLIKQRLSLRRSQYAAVQYLGQLVKTHLNFG